MRHKNERKPLEFYLGLRYPITLVEEAEGGYTALIPDLPGCVSAGETVEEALGMVEDARRLWLEMAYERGDEIPLPRGKMILGLSEKERKLLLELLDDHLYYGWIEKNGEFELVSSGRFSLTLERLYRRLKKGWQEPPPANREGGKNAG